MVAHSMVVVVPIDEAAQVPCVDPSIVNLGHLGSEINIRGDVISLHNHVFSVYAP